MFQALWTMSAVNYLLSIFPWTILFLFVRFIGIGVYHLKNKETCRRLQRRVGEGCTIRLDNEEGAGFFIGCWYLGNINVSKNDYGDFYHIWVIATPSSYRKLTQMENKVFDSPNLEIKNEYDESTLTIFERTGSYSNNYFIRRIITFSKPFEPLPIQKYIMESIIEYQKNNISTIAYISGKPGTGKSFIGVLLAQELKASYCNTLQPWVPGDFLVNLYSETEPSQKNRLVIVLDEIDIALERIHNGITLHTNIPTCVPDKLGWTRFLDEINWGMFPHLILLLISNRPPSFINEMDPAYIRKGRVNLEFSTD